MKGWAALGLAAALGGCGTITRGSMENVTVNTEPSAAQVRTSTGMVCSASPCTFHIERKPDITVTASKEGYAEQSVVLKSAVSKGGAASFAGNVLAGGVIGMGVDVATGAALSHSPNPLTIVLQPLPPPISAPPPPVISKGRPRPSGRAPGV